jgi:hypothetical protein
LARAAESHVWLGLMFNLGANFKWDNGDELEYSNLMTGGY